jgi:hypothetical protein
MKNLSVLLAVLILASCQKKSDDQPGPDMSVELKEVSGVYLKDSKNSSNRLNFSVKDKTLSREFMLDESDINSKFNCRIREKWKNVSFSRSGGTYLVTGQLAEVKHIPLPRDNFRTCEKYVKENQQEYQKPTQMKLTFTKNENGSVTLNDREYQKVNLVNADGCADFEKKYYDSRRQYQEYDTSPNYLYVSMKACKSLIISEGRTDMLSLKAGQSESAEVDFLGKKDSIQTNFIPAGVQSFRRRSGIFGSPVYVTSVTFDELGHLQIITYSQMYNYYNYKYQTSSDYKIIQAYSVE